jgi:hypothetical protein
LSLAQIAELLEDRDKFDGYSRLQVTHFQILPAEDPYDPEIARVRGVVTYDNRAPLELVAELELEEESWRINSIGLGSPESQTNQ